LVCTPFVCVVLEMGEEREGEGKDIGPCVKGLKEKRKCWKKEKNGEGAVELGE